MTTLQKTLFIVIAVALAGAAIDQGRQAAHLCDQARTIQQQQASLADQIRQLQAERDRATNRLANLLAENSRLKTQPDQNELTKLRQEVALLKNEVDQANAGSEQPTVNLWLSRVNLLKQRFAETPAWAIPELKLLSEEDWIATVKDLPLDSDRIYRLAASNLRYQAQEKFADQIDAALKKYQQANDNKFPSDLGLLREYFSQPMDIAMLDNWEIRPGKSVWKYASELCITQKSAVDDVLDEKLVISEGGGHIAHLNFLDPSVLDPVYDAFYKANVRDQFTWEKLLEYVITPEQLSMYHKVEDARFFWKEGYRRSGNGFH